MSKEKLDMFNFLRRLNGVLSLVNNEDYKFTTEEFYEWCRDETLIDILWDFGIAIPELETNQQKFMELLHDEVDDTKNFEDGRCALIYYSWRFLVNYIDKTSFWEPKDNYQPIGIL